MFIPAEAGIHYKNIIYEFGLFWAEVGFLVCREYPARLSFLRTFVQSFAIPENVVYATLTESFQRRALFRRCFMFAIPLMLHDCSPNT